ncbi:hypothetical protein ABFV57_27495, partial [Pseudomonas neuropathica]|uniref:hypothetical protein n=1 Tax=Pseudomonas neuropathica TaxID=2730425 RepID=UPI0034D3CBD7
GLAKKNPLPHPKRAKQVALTSQISGPLGCRPCTTWLSAVLSGFFAKQVRNFLRTMATRHHLVEAAASRFSDQKIAAFGSSYIWNVFPL